MGIKLNLSGVNHRNLQIKTLANLPVGKKFQEKAQVFIYFNISSGLVFTPHRDLRVRHLIEYLTAGTGISN